MKKKGGRFAAMEVIPVNIEVERTNAMYLRQQQADGKLGEFRFELDSIVPAGILVTVDGEKYAFSAEALVRAAVDAHQRRDKSKTGEFVKGGK